MEQLVAQSQTMTNYTIKRETIFTDEENYPHQFCLFGVIFYSVSKLIIPINGVFVPLDGVPGCGSHAAAGVGGLGVLVWRVWTSGSGGGSQVNGLQRAGSSSMVVVMVVWVSIHPTHPLQPVVGQVFILKQR